jgi:hypothetical protein
MRRLVLDVTPEQIMDAMFSVYQDSMGGAVFGLLVWGGTATTLYVRQESIILPLVLTLILGGIVITQVPSPAVALFVVVLLFVGGLGPVFILKRLGV